MLTGSLVALVTPMFDDGRIDWEAYRRLIDWHVDQDTEGLVVVGTTGESPTVNVEEHAELIRVAVEQAAGRIPVIAGTGANSTQEAIELTRYAQQAGAHSTLGVTPYYNKPGQDGLYRHFRAIAEATDASIVLYNVPGRTGTDLHNETTLRLAEIPNICGIKDATGNLERGTDLILRAPADFALYSGDDATALAFMLLGGHGVISVTANVAPRAMHQMCAAAAAGQLQEARTINARLFPLHGSLFCEANPIPVKWAVQQLGLIPGGIRLPMTVLAQDNQARVRAALVHAGLLS